MKFVPKKKQKETNECVVQTLENGQTTKTSSYLVVVQRFSQSFIIM